MLNEQGGIIGIHAALAGLAAGQLTSLALTQTCLERIEDPAGEGERAFIKIYREQALATARACDMLRAAGVPQGPLAGIPISIKDLFDVAGETTTAGSVVLRNAAAALRDAPIVSRLREAGAVIIGKTNMSEFAYSGIGFNPHYGTPLSPYQREAGRVPGGSSSGGAVSVSDSMALGAIGSDTGGSTRIPAAFCGIVGFKPSRRRVPTAGAFPLASSFDSIGPLANCVADCRLLDRVMSGEPAGLRTRRSRPLRLGFAIGLPMMQLDPEVGFAFDRAINKLRQAGIQIDPVEGVDWDELLSAARVGRMTAVECLTAHGSLFEQKNSYDPRIVNRMSTAVGFPATEYLAASERLERQRAKATLQLREFDAVLLPTVASIPPRLADLATDDAFFTANARALRNTTLANLLDGCAISIPANRPGEPPVGLMLMGGNGADDAVFDAAEHVEQILATCKLELHN